MVGGRDPLADREITRTLWEEITSFAEQCNVPGVFTALIGYEWSSAPGGNTLHRVVLYRDGADKANRLLPFAATGSAAPEYLWDSMETSEAETGGDLLTVPHHGNLSNGVMFAIETLLGDPLDTA